MVERPRIGNYELIKQIGEGGFARTYLGRHVLLGTYACLKQNIKLDDEDRELLLNEAKLLWDVDYYCLAGLRDVIDLDEDGIVIVMKFVNGVELYKLVDEHYARGLHPEHACWIAQRLLSTLRYLHSKGVVHGDVKPQNIMLEESEEYPQYASHAAWLVDFGLATLKPRRITKCPGYTPAFAAPEQYAGKPPIPHTDIYGLGATLIHVVGGDIGALTMPDRVPRDMQKVIQSMVRRNPMERSVNHEALQREFSNVRKKHFGGRETGTPLRIKW